MEVVLQFLTPELSACSPALGWADSACRSSLRGRRCVSETLAWSARIVSSDPEAAGARRQCSELWQLSRWWRGLPSSTGMTSQIDELTYGTLASWIPLISVKTFEVRLQPNGPVQLFGDWNQHVSMCAGNFSINLQRCELDEYRRLHQSGQRETVLMLNAFAQLR